MRSGVHRVRIEGRSGRRVAGGIAIMAALLLPILFGFAALVVDVGRMFIFKTEVQTAMDACALASSSALTGSTDPAIFDTARAHGLAMSDPSKVGVAARDAISVNRLHFQRDSFSQSDIAVEFSTALSGQAWIEATATSHVGITPQTAKYVRCRYTDANNPLFFAPVLRTLVPSAAVTMDVRSHAVASLTPSQSSCAVPIAVCSSAGGTAANNYGHAVGDRMVAVTSPSAAYGTGNFGWVDFTPPSNTANELYNLMIGSGSCSTAIGNHVGAQGQKANVERAWNSRFGLYANAGGLSVTTAPPDFSGYSYPTTASNFVDYETRLASRAAYQSATIPNNYTPTTGGATGGHGTYGQKRRIATAVVVNCSVWSGAGGGSAQPPVLDFACILLLAPVKQGGGWDATVADNMAVEYLGLASVVGTPCASSGYAGGSYGPPVPTLVQ